MISKKLVVAVLGITWAVSAPSQAQEAKIYAYEGLAISALQAFNL